MPAHSVSPTRTTAATRRATSRVSAMSDRVSAMSEPLMTAVKGLYSGRGTGRAMACVRMSAGLQAAHQAAGRAGGVLE